MSTITAEAKTTISGEGTVEKVVLNEDANNSSVSTPNTKTTVATGVTGATAGGGVAIAAGSSATNNSTGNGATADVVPVIIPPAPPIVTVNVSAIAVTAANNATTVVYGGTLQMSAAVTPTNATDKTVTWSVENTTGSAIIDANGLLTAKGLGAVTVKATNVASGISVALVVTVTIENQAAPTGLAGIAITTLGAIDGKITGTGLSFRHRLVRIIKLRHPIL